MVAQSKFENAVLETHKEVGTIFALAVKEVQKNVDIEIKKDVVPVVAENSTVKQEIHAESQKQLSKSEVPLQ